MFAKTLFPTPILNTKKFSQVFGGYPQQIFLDELGLLRPLEMIALENEVFIIVNEHMDNDEKIFEIKLSSYVSSKPLYIDSRFVSTSKDPFVKRTSTTPPAEQMLEEMEKMIGIDYVWGGNFSRGIEIMKKFYPPKRTLTHLEDINWRMKGVDCSGLLYEASNGTLPRNTADLLNIGAPIDINNKSIREIAKLLKPLDLILWRGHVVIVFNENLTIESRAHRGGVFFTNLDQRLDQIVREEKKTFVSSPDLVSSQTCCIVRWV